MRPPRPPDARRPSRAPAGRLRTDRDRSPPALRPRARRAAGRPGGGRGFDVSQANSSRGYLLLEAEGDDNPMNLAAADDSVTIMLWQKNVANLDSSSFWFVADSQARGIQAHLPWSNGSIYLDSNGCCSAPSQRLDKGAPEGFDYLTWHHYAFVKNKEAKLAVIGLGYVGLPIALEFARSIKVFGFDINQKRVDMMRNNIDPSPNMDARIWACACQRLSKKIKENDALSPPEKEKLANIVIALRNAKNSNEHLQINAKNENDNLRDMNEHEYMLIANLLGSLLRAAQSDNVELEN